MGILVLDLLFTAIFLIVGLIFTIIGMFLGHIILFDSIFFAIISGLISNKLLHIHPALSLLIGLFILVFLLWIQNTKFGFWIIGSLLSFFWAFVFSFFAYTFSDKDIIWTYTVLGLGFIIMILLHIKAKNN